MGGKRQVNLKLLVIANPSAKHESLRVRAQREAIRPAIIVRFIFGSDDHRRVKIDGDFSAHMFDPAFPIRS
jgi:hypothetical protein